MKFSSVETSSAKGVGKKELLNIRNPKRPERIRRLKEIHGSRIQRKTIKILNDIKSGKK